MQDRNPCIKKWQSSFHHAVSLQTEIALKAATPARFADVLTYDDFKLAAVVTFKFKLVLIEEITVTKSRFTSISTYGSQSTMELMKLLHMILQLIFV
jgi:hypothetical protein